MATFSTIYHNVDFDNLRDHSFTGAFHHITKGKILTFPSHDHNNVHHLGGSEALRDDSCAVLLKEVTELVINFFETLPPLRD